MRRLVEKLVIKEVIGIIDWAFHALIVCNRINNRIINVDYAYCVHISITHTTFFWYALAGAVKEFWGFEATFAVSICAWFLKCQFGSLLQTWKKNWFRIKLDFFSSSNLIFTACVACKNQVRTRKKIKFDSKSIFFSIL